MPLDKLPDPELPTMEVKPNGSLTGHTFIMREPPSWLLFAEKAPSDRQTGRAALEAIIDSSLRYPPGRLPPKELLKLATQWLEDWGASAFPPTSGTPSEKPLPSEPPSEAGDSPASL